MHEWPGFYVVLAGAAATLAGLLFVAISVNAAAVLTSAPAGSRRLAAQAFENYLVVLMVGLLSLWPDMSPLMFGRVALVVTASWIVWGVVRLYQASAEPSVHETRLRALRGHASTLVGFGLLIYAFARMAIDGAPTRDTLAAGCGVLLFSATENAWGRLNRIAVVRR